ncbi:hypothetical protein GCM10017602_15840 [Herbiconiux flava]|nr:hypothetical protein GCM10017602_15840 [Herbiconiux flava]
MGDGPGRECRACGEEAAQRQDGCGEEEREEAEAWVHADSVPGGHPEPEVGGGICGERRASGDCAGREGAQAGAATALEGERRRAGVMF